MDEERLFHLTGRRSGALAAADGLRPALLAPFGDLTRLRYEFPLVLLAPSGDGPLVRTLSGIVDDAVRAAGTAGPEQERLRAQVHRVERAIRSLLEERATGTLASLWSDATRRAGGDPALARLADALPDGEAIACDPNTPLRVVEHAWRLASGRRGATLRRLVDGLAHRLSDLVRADLLRSREGRRAEVLRSGFGPAHQDLFDFELMAHLVATPSGSLALPPRRRHRIENVLAELRVGRPLADAPGVDTIRGALAWYQRRIPRMAGLVRALAVAELEVTGRYVDAEHDPVVGAMGAVLGTEERALFPAPLARVGPSAEGISARAEILDALLSDLPLKLLIETDDALGEGGQLAATAMRLDGVFVVQTTSSHLRSAAPAILAALEHPGPALISVYTGARSTLPAYLVAAAAAEARAFPGFARDPRREPPVTLLPVAQPDRAWPAHVIRYADRELQRAEVSVELTPADVALLDPAWAAHFAVVPWDRGEERPPFVYAVDGDERLHKVLVDDRIAELAKRRGEAWTRLRALAESGPAPAARPAPATVPANGHAAPAPAAAAPTPAATVAATETARDPNEAYIETARCSTCNECTLINPRMFAYNADRQAYIADASAGTYRELVEAAESCQVAIIHPGAPRDPSEPGLAELIERAAAFR